MAGSGSGADGVREHRSFELVGPVESADFDGRVTPVAGPCRISWQEACVGAARMRLMRAGAFRYERTERWVASRTDRLVTLALGAGRLSGTFGGRAVEMRPGDVVVVDGGAAGHYECGEGTQLLGIAVESAAIPRPWLASASPSVRLEQSALLVSTVGFATSLLHGGSGRLSAHLESAIGALQTQVVQECRSRTPSDDLRSRISAYVGQHLTDPMLDPGRIAAEFGISLRRVHAVFAQGDVTVARYIRERRVDAVAEALAAEHGVTTSELAARFGFGSADVLARAFRARFGTSMTRYRRGRF